MIGAPWQVLKVPCAGCSQLVKGKLATVYSAWFNTQGEREAWKQRFCAPCLMQAMDALKALASENLSDLIVCVSCGANSSESINAIYLNVYLPKQEGREYALPMCDSCASSARELLQVNASKLPDRGNQSKGDDPWSSITL